MAKRENLLILVFLQKNRILPKVEISRVEYITVTCRHIWCHEKCLGRVNLCRRKFAVFTVGLSFVISSACESPPLTPSPPKEPPREEQCEYCGDTMSPGHQCDEDKVKCKACGMVVNPECHE